ncbi:hypothetical protein BDC45DRAFT_524648, partial [Circinella umbellata]
MYFFGIDRIGLAGMGFNTFLKGRPRRGEKKFRSAHYHSTAVGLQNEHRSSQTCVFCFSPFELLSLNIFKNGKKKKTSHGALICTKPEDSVGTTGIGLAGRTTLLSPNHIPLPPCNPSPTTTTISTTTSKFQLDEKFSL